MDAVYDFDSRVKLYLINSTCDGFANFKKIIKENEFDCIFEAIERCSDGYDRWIYTFQSIKSFNRKDMIEIFSKAAEGCGISIFITSTLGAVE